MRNLVWVLGVAIVLGGLFWPFLFVFGGFVLFVCAVGAVTGRRR